MQTKNPDSQTMDPKKARCVFCGKTADEVAGMIQVPMARAFATSAFCTAPTCLPVAATLTAAIPARAICPIRSTATSTVTKPHCAGSV